MSQYFGHLLHPALLHTCRCLILPPVTPSAWAKKKQKRADVVGAEALYKKAGAIDPCHANSIYNYAVLLDSSLKQQEVRPLQTAGYGAILRDSRSTEVTSYRTHPCRVHRKSVAISARVAGTPPMNPLSHADL